MIDNNMHLVHICQSRQPGAWTPVRFLIFPSDNSMALRCLAAPKAASSETQGQIVGARESLNRRKNMARKKSKERPEEPLGTTSYQTSSKRSPPFWLLIGARKLVFLWHQSEARTCVVLLFLAPTICPWVSEDAKAEE